MITVTTTIITTLKSLVKFHEAFGEIVDKAMPVTDCLDWHMDVNKEEIKTWLLLTEPLETEPLVM